MLKQSLLLICGLLFVETHFSQGNIDSPKLIVLGQKWKRENSVTLIPNKSPINEIEPDKINSASPSLDYVKAKYFLYETTVSNQTGKSIKGFSWDYIFYDSKTKTELKRHQFFYSSKIKKNKKVTVKIMSQTPPANLINAGDYGKDSQSQYIEEIQLTCIVFDDKTIWYPPNLTISACKDLKSLILSLVK